MSLVLLTLNRLTKASFGTIVMWLSNPDTLKFHHWASRRGWVQERLWVTAWRPRRRGVYLSPKTGSGFRVCWYLLDVHKGSRCFSLRFPSRCRAPPLLPWIVIKPWTLPKSSFTSSSACVCLVSAASACVCHTVHLFQPMNLRNRVGITPYLLSTLWGGMGFGTVSWACAHHLHPQNPWS